MHPSVHCSAIYNSQDMEVTEVISRGMDKHTHTHTHTHTQNGILLSHKQGKKKCIQSLHSICSLC